MCVRALLRFAAPMSAQLRKKSGRGAAAEPPAYAEEQPSPRKPLSLYRRPPGKKKERTDRAKRAVLIRWGRTEAAAAISAGEGRTVQWGKLCTLDAMASTTPAVEHLRALGVLKAAPAAGSLRLRAVAAAVLAAELGGPEHSQLGAAELSKLAHGFACRNVESGASPCASTRQPGRPEQRCPPHRQPWAAPPA